MSDGNSTGGEPYPEQPMAELDVNHRLWKLENEIRSLGRILTEHLREEHGKL